MRLAPVTALGLPPMGSLNLLSPEPKSTAPLGLAVSNGSRNDQLNFSSGSMLAPDLQFPTKAFRAFPHPRKAPMSGTSALNGNFGVDSTSVVPDVQQKLRFAIHNFRFNFLGLRVPEGVPQRF